MENNTILNFKNFLDTHLPRNDINSEKFYEDMLAFFSETKKDYINRRQKELKNEGFQNNEIFKKLIIEVNNRLFKGKLLTERQIKRIIYKE